MTPTLQQGDVEVITSSTMELIQRAEIDMQIATAKRYPRDLAVVKKKMLSFATLDEETAESCFYTLPRDGKTIQGPTVRLAEIAVACYGNLRAASRVISNDGKIITSQAACHDLENNTLISVEVQRRITNKQGKTYSEDMQVTAGNAANSIAFRNAVFKVVPGALVKPVYEAAKAVAVGTASTLAVKREKMVKRLNGMQVPTAKILLKLGRSSIESIDLSDLEILIGLGTAIKDGDISIDEAFKANDHDDKLDKKMEDQARDAARAEQSTTATQQEQSKPEPKQDAPVPETYYVPRWPTADAMMMAFSEMRVKLEDDPKFWNILAASNVNGEDDVKLESPAVGAAFDALVAAVEAKNNPAPAAKTTLQFGRKPKQ